jgi:hypothetical protein
MEETEKETQPSKSDKVEVLGEVPEWKKGDMNSMLLEESTFATLFPQYRER